jgi:hypothetical protein
MLYLKKSFTVAPGQNKAFRDNFDATFGKKTTKSPKKAPKTKGQKTG